MEKPEAIIPVYIDGRYGPHMLIPFKNPWNGLEGEELNNNQQEFLLPESYYRAIGDSFEFPEAIDPDGGPFMTIGHEFRNYYGDDRYRIDKFDCRGKYPILICNKLQ